MNAHHVYDTNSPYSSVISLLCLPESDIGIKRNGRMVYSCVLFKDSVSSSDYIESNCDLEGNGRDLIGVGFLYLSGCTEINHEELQLGQQLSRPTFEPRIPRIQVNSFTLCVGAIYILYLNCFPSSCLSMPIGSYSFYFFIR